MATRWLFGTHEDELPPSPDLEDAAGDDVIPEQLPSILGQRACITYYVDGAREPTTVATSDAAVPAEPRCYRDAYPVFLLLDMTKGCGGKIWPAAEVLGAYIASMPMRYAPGSADLALARHPWRGKRIVELGSGTGLIGFLVAKIGCGCTTWITDQSPMLPLMHENHALNGDMSDACHVAELDWGHPVAEEMQHPDVILLADCVYRESAFQPLVDTLCELATPATEILFCYHKRRKADKRFFALLKPHFLYTHVEDDDPARRAAYNRNGTFLMRFCKRSP